MATKLVLKSLLLKEMKTNLYVFVYCVLYVVEFDHLHFSAGNFFRRFNDSWLVAG